MVAAICDAKLCTCHILDMEEVMFKLVIAWVLFSSFLLTSCCFYYISRKRWTHAIMALSVPKIWSMRVCACVSVCVCVLCVCVFVCVCHSYLVTTLGPGSKMATMTPTKFPSFTYILRLQHELRLFVSAPLEVGFDFWWRWWPQNPIHTSETWNMSIIYGGHHWKKLMTWTPFEIFVK